MNKSLLAIVLLVLLALTLVACAAPPPSATAVPGATTVPAQPTAAQIAPTSAPAALTPYTARFTVAMQTEIANLDPSKSTSHPANYPVLYNMYDPLVMSAPDGKAMQGGLSTWKVSEDGKTIEFTIRQGVTFSNGDKLTAKDVLFTHNRYLKSCPQYQQDVADKIDKVEVVSDYVIRFIFKQPVATFVLFDAPQLFITDQAYFDKVGEDEFVKNPIGSGAYKFVTWQKGQYIDFAANETYWGQKPQLQNVRVLFVKEDTTRTAMMMAGELDMMKDVPWPNVAQVEKAGFKTARINASPNFAVQFQTFNKKAPWANKLVRQAVAYAIDRQGIVNKLYNGIPGLDAWLAPGELGYDPNIKPYPFDPAKAKALLAEAGYPNGFDMPIYYQIGGNIPGVKDTAEAVASYLQAVGIKAHVVQGIEQVPMLDNIRKWNSDPNAEVVLVRNPSMSNHADPINPLSMNYLSTSPASLYTNPETDALINQGVATLDDTKRGEIIKKIIAIFQDEMPIVPILSNASVFAMKSNISYTPSKFAFALLNLKDITVK